MNNRMIRVGPRWFELEKALRENGIRESRAKLTDGIASFIIDENLLPTMVNRARKRQRRGLFG